MPSVPKIGHSICPEKLNGAGYPRIHIRKATDPGRLRSFSSETWRQFSCKRLKPPLQIDRQHSSVCAWISHALQLAARDPHNYNVHVQLGVVDFQIIHDFCWIGAGGKPFLRWNYFLYVWNVVVAKHLSIKCENSGRYFHSHYSRFFWNSVLNLESRVWKLFF